jgi:hypothetical protein
MAKYQAPEHTTEVFLTSGPFRIDEKGQIEVPDDLPQHDVVALCGAGFTPVAGAALAAPKPIAAKDD